MTAMLALSQQWSPLRFDPGLTSVLAGMERAAEIERLIGNAEARADYWSCLRAGYWGQIAAVSEPIAQTVCRLMDWEYDDELPGFYRRRGPSIPPAHALTLVKAKVGAP